MNSRIFNYSKYGHYMQVISFNPFHSKLFYLKFEKKLKDQKLKITRIVSLSSFINLNTLELAKPLRIIEYLVQKKFKRIFSNKVFFSNKVS